LFFTDSGWWKAAENLKLGDKILNSKGELRTLIGKSVETLQEPEKIYNLNVDQFHTYFVGTSRLLVHNDCTVHMMSVGREAIEKARARGITDADELSQIGEAAAKAVSKVAFGTDCERHLTKVVGFTQKTGVVGGHNEAEFFGYLTTNNIPINTVNAIPHPDPKLNGIYNIEYQVGALDYTGINYIPGKFKADILKKTLYNSSKISDADMFRWGKEAMEEGLNSARTFVQKDGIIVINGEALNGLKFKGFVDPSTGNITNFHPVIDWN
jgi:hypothetical protein